MAHFDESGIRVAASLDGVHVACMARLPWYRAHAKRGHAAMAEAGVLEHFTGTVVADAFTCCQRYGTARALCNAHLLRDLDGTVPTRPGRCGRRRPPTPSTTPTPPASRPAPPERRPSTRRRSASYSAATTTP